MSDEQSIASTSRPGSPIAQLPEFSSSKPYRFAWDASRKPGPSSVSGFSEGRNDYFAYRPALGNLNFSSASLALGAVPQDWSSARLGFNGVLKRTLLHPQPKANCLLSHIQPRKRSAEEASTPQSPCTRSTCNSSATTPCAQERL